MLVLQLVCLELESRMQLETHVGVPAQRLEGGRRAGWGRGGFVGTSQDGIGPCHGLRSREDPIPSAPGAGRGDRAPDRLFPAQCHQGRGNAKTIKTAGLEIGSRAKRDAVAGKMKDDARRGVGGRLSHEGPRREHGQAQEGSVDQRAKTQWVL